MRSNKKHTYEFIAQSFEDEGYVLLSTSYKNSFTKLDYICPAGHEHSITWSNWQQGKRCYYCGLKKIGEPKKLKFSFVKKSFEDEGYTLLSDKYITAHKKLDYICPAGHTYFITWSNWNAGKRCRYCGFRQIGDTHRKDIDAVRLDFEKAGYQLLSTVYENTHEKLDYICPEGHRGSIRHNNFQIGRRCPICYEIKKSSSYSKDCCVPRNEKKTTP